VSNNNSGDIAAIFDLDGTLYTGHITLGLAEHHRTHRVQDDVPFDLGSRSELDSPGLD
jgi:FMN phosphatase YigB (HAD superfamily)